MISKVIIFVVDVNIEKEESKQDLIFVQVGLQ